MTSIDPTRPTARLATASRCARCAQPFACGLDTGACWCAQSAPLPARRLAALERRYGARCLCPACLRAETESGDAD